jgi:hypothetical protein
MEIILEVTKVSVDDSDISTCLPSVVDGDAFDSEGGVADKTKQNVSVILVRQGPRSLPELADVIIELGSVSGNMVLYDEYIETNTESEMFEVVDIDRTLDT